ncbi:hypothetical protein GCG21_02940 [Pseudactinotalea sp. HY160]|uniref:hypothetical protein n=1 Tax=Pseudactinotalea sp. HY160 TaxID=2654490 RepID=UPI00128CE876|nr:hypothetical protein [Pseudactinotalea sp. HY160]MPV48981.1 hypothetical protein [Pseudactinotalea sp. HY160]
MTDSLVDVPMLNDKQTAGWHALLDLYQAHPTGWTLVGGQMVHLWCAARQSWPTRPTDDADAVLDVRGHPHALLPVTTALSERGFTPDGTTWRGHQHRWVRDDATIDLLIPRFLGETAANRVGIGGGTTLETPGAPKALNRTSPQPVTVAGRHGTVPRPSLLGALGAKAATRTVMLDRARDRHLIDFAVLAALLVPADVRNDSPLDHLERARLVSMVGDMKAHRLVWAVVEGSAAGLQRVELALRTRAIT